MPGRRLSTERALENTNGCCSLARTRDGPLQPISGLGGTLFGYSTSWLSWHWRETALTGAAALVLLGLLAALRRRRRTRVSG